MSVSQKLQARVAAGQLEPDAAQMSASKALDALLDRLKTPPRRAGLFSRRKIAPIGLYLWGGVGRGKSMLMDWFYELAPIRKKRRVHFHAFMLDVHDRIAKARLTYEGEPIARVAKNIAQEARLLCFDEFHVTDIADAMILSRLFEALWLRGVTVVATSNRPPEGLYHNGLNRDLFEPFIEMMPEHLIIHEFSGETDHRLRQLSAAPVYYAPLGAAADKAVQAAWDRLTGEARSKVTELTVQGRKLILKETAAGTARTSFNRLCGEPLGAADYLRLSHAFQTLILENVPQMDRDMKNEAKRFVMLIDALYETRTKLIMSAEVEPARLYVDGDGSFEFERTASRLIEMRSADYLGARRNLGESG